MVLIIQLIGIVNSFGSLRLFEKYRHQSEQELRVDLKIEEESEPKTYQMQLHKLRTKRKLHYEQETNTWRRLYLPYFKCLIEDNPEALRLQNESINFSKGGLVFYPTNLRDFLSGNSVVCTKDALNYTYLGIRSTAPTTLDDSADYSAIFSDKLHSIENLE